MFCQILPKKYDFSDRLENNVSPGMHTSTDFASNATQISYFASNETQNGCVANLRNSKEMLQFCATNFFPLFIETLCSTNEEKNLEQKN